jgi:hypothetical protein
VSGSVKRCQAPFAEVVEFVVELVYECPLCGDRDKHAIVAKPRSRTSSREVPGTNNTNPENAEDCMLGLAKSGNKTIRSGFQMDTKVTKAKYFCS